MEIRCEYCGSMLSENLSECPNCGAPNKAVATVSDAPQTIEELLDFCRKRHIPLEAAHFHIGEDYRGPKAFGIYKDEDGLFTVYKNKSDGTRLIRYHGADEDYAVNEIFQKMRAEILVRHRR